MNLMNLEMDSTVFKSDVFLAKFGHKLLLSLSAQPDYVSKCWIKIIAWTFCSMDQSIFRLNYILNNHAYFSDFHTHKFPLIFFN